MPRDEVIAMLNRHEAALRERGVAHIALFGSTARGEARPDSDIDLLVELAPDTRMGLFEYSALVQFLEDLFPLRLDVVNGRKLKSEIKKTIEHDALYAF